MPINWKPNKYLGEGSYEFVVADAQSVGDDGGYFHQEFKFQVISGPCRDMDKESRIYNQGEYAALCAACGVPETVEPETLVGRQFSAEVFKTEPNKKTGKSYYNLRGYSPPGKPTAKPFNKPAEAAPRNDPKVAGVLAPKPAKKWGSTKTAMMAAAAPAEEAAEGDAGIPF